MKPLMSGTTMVVGLIALSSISVILNPGISFAQAPDKGNPPAAHPAPRAANPAPRAVARPPTARAPAQRPVTVQPSRPQRPAAVRPAQQRAVKQGSAPARIKRQVQEPRQQLKVRRTQPVLQPSAPKQVEKGLRRPEVAGKRGQQGIRPVARDQVTDQTRREIHRSLAGDRRVQRLSRSQLNVPLTIGSRIPRRHRLYRFTPALLALAPMYAAYSYLMVDDTICVVDPETYAIVDMIPPSIEEAGPPSSSQGALALSGEQMRCVYANAPKDRARTDLRIRLALGAEIPRSVELFPFPMKPWRCAPELANYTYIVVQDDVVIVEPTAYAVVQVISD